MKLRNWLTLGGVTLGAVGAGLMINSFLPQHFLTTKGDETLESVLCDRTSLPDVEVSFLRCGSQDIPEFVAVRGAFSAASCLLAHSAVLVRHPRGTFLYDSGLCTDIALFLMDQSLFFKRTLGGFVLEQPIGSHLQRQGIGTDELAFVLVSHLHWDHVSGIPDLPGVPLRINRVEYDAGRQGLLEQHQGLVRRLMGNNPVELFDLDGPAYEGFHASHDLFGDGSIILVPLPGHTPGQVGMFVNHAHGSRLFVVGDAAWVADNYAVPATMHPFIWSRVTSDDASARQTLIDLHRFARRHPEIPIIPMHDAHMQENFSIVEATRTLAAK